MQGKQDGAVVHRGSYRSAVTDVGQERACRGNAACNAFRGRTGGSNDTSSAAKTMTTAVITGYMSKRLRIGRCWMSWPGPR